MAVFYNPASESWVARTGSSDGTIQVTEGFASQLEAMRWEHEHAVNTAPDRVRLMLYAEDTYLPAKRKKVSEEAYQGLEKAFRSYIFPCLGSVRLSRLKTADINAWHGWLSKQKDRSGNLLKNAYLRQIHSMLSSALKAAANDTGLRFNAAVAAGNFPSENRSLTWWTPDEFRLFCRATEDERTLLAFRLMFWTGIMEGELLALTPADYRQENGTILIHSTWIQRKGGGVIRKTGRIRKRTVSIPPSLIPSFEAIISDVPEGCRIFPETRASMRRKLVKGAVKAGIPEIMVQDLRTSHVRVLIGMNVSVEDIAAATGNTSQTILMRYREFFPDRTRSIAERISEACSRQ